MSTQQKKAQQFRGRFVTLPQHLFIRGLLMALSVCAYSVRGDQAAAAAPKAIIVVSDDNYPPYCFRDADGVVRGILPDHWKLWEKETGVRVDYRAMDWGMALRAMQEGRADVIEAMFLTEERARLYDFTPAYASLKVPIYVHRSLAGIRDLSSLKGFLIGVKEGDAVIDFLATHGITSVKLYPSYEAIIQAAKNEEVKVFSVDEPPAAYYLYKHGVVADFHEAFILYTGQFHRAVKKGDEGTLRLVKEGFDTIPGRHLRAIERKWKGSPFFLWAILRPWWGWILAGLAAVLFLGLSNLFLQHRVCQKTSELRQALADLQHSTAAQQESEKALRDNHDVILQFIRRSPISTYITEVTGDDCRILMANDHFKPMIGLTGVQVVGKTLSQLFPPEFAAKIAAADRAVLRQDMMLTTERFLNGRTYTDITFPLRVGTRHLVAGYIMDITERKQADAERERLMRAIEQSSETVLITDADGMIVYVNPAFTQITGYAQEEVLGHPPQMLQSGEHDTAFYRKMWQTLRTGGTWSGQLINKRKDGTRFIELATISPVRDSAGAVINYVAVKRDITEQIRAIEEKTALESRLAHVQKLEAVGRLAGGVAHDFNNMLQAILGYTEMALDQVVPGRTLYNDLLEIKKAAQRSAVLTQQLQTFARKDVVSPKPLNLNTAVVNILTMLHQLIGRDISLEWKPADHLVAVLLDAGQFDQIVANLVLNARDAVEPSGRIILETTETTVTAVEAQQLKDIIPGDYICFSVSDDGCGMSPDVLEHIFEPFFTTKRIGRGTGMGLAAVYGIVKQGGGYIYIDSEPGKGTLVQIYLPCASGVDVTTDASITPDAPLVAPCAIGQETILLVDDETSILAVTGRILTNLGYYVLAASSPAEALNLFEVHKDQIDLLVTDVVMPSMSGPEMVKRMLESRPRLRYLFVSGNTSRLIANNGFAENVHRCILKPCSSSALAQKIRECLTQD